MSGNTVGTVDALWRYPVSSVGGEKVTATHVHRKGLKNDRLFAIFDHETGDPVNPAKKQWYGVPKLQARLEDGRWLQLSIDTHSWFRHDDPVLTELLSSLYGRPVSVHPYGVEFAGKIASHRYTLSPIHLLSRHSLEALKQLLPESNVDERRFRPNIVVDLPDNGGSEPPEYALIGKEFRLGSLRLRGARPCGRCSFTTLEQPGIADDRSILKTLISNFDKDFGIYCDVVEEGDVAVGDSIVVVQKPRQLASVAVVGAGQAGGTLARVLRELGHNGPITLFGDESHAPYERPPLSKSFEPTKALTLPITSVLSASDADELAIDLHLDERVVHIDRSRRVLETASGFKHSYDYVVLATGGDARRIPLLNRGHGRVHSIRTIRDAQTLHGALEGSHKIFVVGGGWLGLEMASAARKASVDVDLFARQSHLCSRVLPKVVAEFIADAHRRDGVNLHLGIEPRFVEYPDRIEAHYQGRIETADLLIAAIGITPNDHLARHAGLECSDGVLTDVDGRTSDPNVFAIGDVSRQRSPGTPQGIRLESWQNAIEQAGRAARAILEIKVPDVPLPRFWSDQCGFTIHIAGMPDPSATPISVDGLENPFWRFKGFAVGINRAKDVHQFAVQQASSTTTVKSDKPDEIITDSPKRTTRYVVGELEPIADGEFVKVSIAELGEILIVNTEGRYYAVDDICPHANASLAEGFVESRRIVCPLHFAEFDLVHGTAYSAPNGCPKAKTYDVEVENEVFYLWE